MAELQAHFGCYRSLPATLSAAASSLALFAAANWGIFLFFFDESALYTTAHRIIFHTVFAFGMPLLPLFISMVAVLELWSVENMLRDVEATSQNMGHQQDCVSIITLCPLFIQVPVGVEIPRQLECSSKRIEVSREEFLKKFRPLELRPDPPHPSVDMQIVEQNSRASHAWVYLEFPRYFLGGNLDALRCRVAILSAGLAPKWTQLSIIRSRNKFQSVVTALQAGGCVLSLLQRLLQHLGISPVEAISAFLGIVVALQLLMEIYACGTYQCPLLLCLDDARQLQHFQNALQRLEDRSDSAAINERALALIVSGGMVSGGMVIALVPALFYFAHYVHTHLISALSSFLFFLSQTMFGTGFFIAQFTRYENAGVVLMFSSAVVYAGSLIGAVVGTIVEWRAFHNPSLHNWFAWIVPHVAS